MIATIVSIEVKSEFIKEFINECIKNHQESIKEPGNLRFDVLQDAANPAKFSLYEAYETEEAVLAHKQTTHYNAWRTNVEPMMAKARVGVKHNVIRPTNIDLW
jgi:autoinducer 2-degrading protein